MSDWTISGKLIESIWVSSSVALTWGQLIVYLRSNRTSLSEVKLFLPYNISLSDSTRRFPSYDHLLSTGLSQSALK